MSSCLGRLFSQVEGHPAIPNVDAVNIHRCPFHFGTANVGIVQADTAFSKGSGAQSVAARHLIEFQFCLCWDWLRKKFAFCGVDIQYSYADFPVVCVLTFGQNKSSFNVDGSELIGLPAAKVCWPLH